MTSMNDGVAIASAQPVRLAAAVNAAAASVLVTA